MCRQVAPIALAVGPELTREAVLSELFELLRDEENAVRMGALAAAVALLEHMTAEHRRQYVYPAMRANATSQDDGAAAAAAGLFGALALKATGDLEDEAVFESLLGTFAGLAGSQDGALREACAAAFPAVLKAVGSRKYAMHLHSMYVALACDQDEAVRRVVAEGFSEVRVKERGTRD